MFTRTALESSLSKNRLLRFRVAVFSLVSIRRYLKHTKFRAHRGCGRGRLRGYLGDDIKNTKNAYGMSKLRPDNLFRITARARGRGVMRTIQPIIPISGANILSTTCGTRFNNAVIDFFAIRPSDRASSRPSARSPARSFTDTPDFPHESPTISAAFVLSLCSVGRRWTNRHAKAVLFSRRASVDCVRIGERNKIFVRRLRAHVRARGRWTILLIAKSGASVERDFLAFIYYKKIKQSALGISVSLVSTAPRVAYVLRHLVV